MSELSISAAPKGLSVDKDLALSIHFDWRTLLPLASVAFTQVLHTVLPVTSTYCTQVLPGGRLVQHRCYRGTGDTRGGESLQQPVSGALHV
ncbi:MAG: hypothetical protein LBJ41_02240 [Treponema sp.]|jgi:hypothetical protein|nr:hypothetical protein [Treponema sp.]